MSLEFAATAGAWPCHKYRLKTWVHDGLVAFWVEYLAMQDTEYV
jgi:hypothetical protein